MYLLWRNVFSCPLLICQLYYFSVTELYEFLTYFGYRPLIRYIICKYILLFSRLSCFVEGFFCCVKSFLVWCSPICLFLLLFPLLEGTYPDRYLLKLSVYLLCFLLLVLLFQALKFLTRFELIFVYGIRERSFHSFSCICPVFPILLLLDNIESSNPWTKYMDLFARSLTSLSNVLYFSVCKSFTYLSDSSLSSSFVLILF